MTEGANVDDQRLAFGRVAELYDRARPSYPEALVDDVIAFAGVLPPARLLEVGAGTGKATRLFAKRGFGVLALEPSKAMAAVARRKCAPYPAVEIEEVDFERWSPREPLPAIISGAAWHWVAPEMRYVRAREALAAGGTLAAFWTFPSWEECALLKPLSDAYRRAAPGLEPNFPMHPGSRPTDLAGDWEADIEAAESFGGAQVCTYPWRWKYSAAGYVQLLQTHQDHILLENRQRGALLAAVARVIDDAGGKLEMSYVTRLCLARRV